MSTGFEASQPGGAWQGRGACGHYGWKPVEILAVVIAFAIYWPLGLAVLAWKIAQRKGYAMPDIFEAARDRFAGFSGSFGRSRNASWRPFGEPTSGNAAFDDWRKAELERLEAERRKLEDAEREFAEHMANLRRARDREEFDRFMAARGGASQG